MSSAIIGFVTGDERMNATIVTPKQSPLAKPPRKGTSFYKRIIPRNNNKHFYSTVQFPKTCTHHCFGSLR